MMPDGWPDKLFTLHKCGVMCIRCNQLSCDALGFGRDHVEYCVLRFARMHGMAAGVYGWWLASKREIVVLYIWRNGELC